MIPFTISTPSISISTNGQLTLLSAFSFLFFVSVSLFSLQSPEVDRLLERVSSASDDELPLVLDSISEWCWPRGDLHYWTQTLNRFDSILEETCKDYQLKDVSASNPPPTTANGVGFSSLQINEFTPNRKRLLVSVLRFSRLLIENCTNRKLYASYEVSLLSVWKRIRCKG